MVSHLPLLPRSIRCVKQLIAGVALVDAVLEVISCDIAFFLLCPFILWQFEEDLNHILRTRLKQAQIVLMVRNYLCLTLSQVSFVGLRCNGTQRSYRVL